MDRGGHERAASPRPAAPRSSPPGSSSGGQLTGDETRRRAAARLGAFLVGPDRTDGAVLAQYDVRQVRPTPGSRSKYYTGEAYWALARLHRLFPDEGFGEVADRIGKYLATQRDDVEDHWPPIPDHWVGLRAGRDGRVPRARPRRAADRRRARLRPPPGRAVRQPGALGQPAGRAVGLGRARHPVPAAAATASSARR